MSNPGEQRYVRMLTDILCWQKIYCRKFDASTFEGIKDYYDKRGQLTPNQEIAIKNVYLKWKIEEAMEKKVYYVPERKKESDCSEISREDMNIMMNIK